mgnify:CR=1 FL=1
MRFATTFLVLFAVAAPSLSHAQDAAEIVWTTGESGDADVRRGRFQVADGDCAYATMVDPGAMTVAFAHLEGYELHPPAGAYQDLTLIERFWAVGLVHSRYHRTFDGSTRLEWRLVEGRQARHDGFWQVSKLPSGRSEIVFENLIEAKSFMHRPLLKAIQVRTMGAIAEAIIRTCGA